MTDAQRLVTALLDAKPNFGSPREFLKQIGKFNPPPPDQVRYTLDVEPDDYWAIKGSFGEPEDEELIRQQVRDGNTWAWCRVHVQAEWRDRKTGRTYRGDDYLSGCNYGSEEDFKQPGGYYDDMKKVAYDELLANIEADNAAEEDED